MCVLVLTLLRNHQTVQWIMNAIGKKNKIKKMSTISSKVYFNTFPPKPSSAQKKALYYQKQFSTGALQLIIAILYFHP